MRLHQLADGTRVPFTAEEEAQWDAMEAPETPSPREALRLAWQELPVSTRAQFSTTYSAVSLALDQGDKELAVYLVTAAQVPQELESVKAGLLAAVEAI